MPQSRVHRLISHTLYRGAYILAATLVAALITPATAGVSPLPLAVTLPVPGGILKLAPPFDQCAFPAAVTQQMASVMQGLHVVLATGSCADVNTLLQTGASIVGQSMVVAMLDEDFNPATRSAKPAFLRDCFEQFPKPASRTALDDAVAEVNKAQSGILLQQAIPLGLLRATRDAVLGGTLMGLQRGQTQMLQVQVTACVYAGALPIIWLFQQTLDRHAPAQAISQRLQDMLSLSLDRIEATQRLNSAVPKAP